MKRIFFLTVCLFITHSVHSQEDCCKRRPYIDIDFGYTVGRFIGLEENYGELGIFIAPQRSTQWQPFFDLRGYKLEFGNQYAANFGIGLRGWDCTTCRFWGANIYYDFRSACKDNFNRIGLGFESLGRFFDYRVNAYFPFHATHESREHCFNNFIGNFKATCRPKEFIFVGADMEFGFTLWRQCYNLLYGAAGPYYYYNKNIEDIVGVFGRVEVHVERYIRLEGLISYDNEFKTRVQGRLVFSIPLDYLLDCRDSCWEDDCTLLRTQRVRRNNVIFTHCCCDWDWNWGK